MRVRDTTSETAPTGANTVVLFNSFVAFAGMAADVHECVRHVVTVKNSQAGSLRLVRSLTGSGSPTSWDVVQEYSAPIPTAPATVTGPVDFPVDGLRHYGLIWINGGVDQVGWEIEQEITMKNRAAQV